MVNKSFLIILTIVILLSLFFIQNIQVIQATSPDDSGTGLLPPCASRGSEIPCGICDVFQLIVNIIHFLLFNIVPPLAILMIVVGGATFMFSSGNPAMLTTGKSIIKSVIIGLVIAYGSYMIVGSILQGLGLASWTSTLYNSWFSHGGFIMNCH